MSFLFQGFQNSVRVVGHFSLFIMTKILRKQFKKPDQYNNENLPYDQNFVVLVKKHAGS